jgi:hypothetical protein
LKILGEYGWENPVTARIRKALSGFFGAIFNLLAALIAPMIQKIKALGSKLPRLNLPNFRKRSRLTFFQDERTRVDFARGGNFFRKMKWKALQNHRERVRFIYISFLRGKIKKGVAVPPSYTPNELAAKFNETDTETSPATDRLFSLYNTARYARAEAVISKEEVEQVLPCASKRLRL